MAWTSWLIGLGISKKWIDACFLTDETKTFTRFENNETGRSALLQELEGKVVSLAVEPAGGYERAICQAFQELQFWIIIPPNPLFPCHSRKIMSPSYAWLTNVYTWNPCFLTAWIPDTKTRYMKRCFSSPKVPG